VVIVWSTPARQDLRLIYQYIAHDSKRYASRVVEDITDKVEILQETPRLGKVVPEIGIYSYRIMYELMNDTIYIHGIVYVRRHFKLFLAVLLEAISQRELFHHQISGPLSEVGIIAQRRN
jgi:toxin ParE1/3/4